MPPPQATTCSLKTAITTSLTLFSGRPTQPGTTLVASQVEGYFCSILLFDVHQAPHDYWLAVEVATRARKRILCPFIFFSKL